MQRLSPEQIARHASEAGFRGDALTTAVAVALAESGGRVRAHNDTPPDDSYGLWQINMYGALGPDRRRAYDLESNRELFDPATNADVAFEISGDGRSFGPWSAYRNGMYRQFLDEARRAARAVTRDGRRGGSGGSGSGGSGGSGGFAVDTDLLGGYVRRARGIADGLDELGATQLRRIGRIADDSFGLIGKESGFAAALDHFAAALHRQVRGVSANTDALARTTARTLRAYRDRDDEIAAQLGRIDA